MLSVEEIIRRIEESESIIEDWSRRRAMGESPPNIVLDLTRPELLERWEAIMMDCQFPGRGPKSRHISRILNLADLGYLVLRPR